ncbi:hypothetical protein ACIGH6_14225 [Brachybacterium paraconglomeratum]|uniref:phage tail tube protein n=1 Tax=Brachybacterium paraconglomeratum TaxID=173362 RepID=UPI0037C8836D
MPKSKAEGREKWILLSAPPADPTAVTLTEATAGIDASCALSSADSRISAAASATFSDPAICDEIAVTEFGQSNYEGNIAPFRFWSDDGTSEVGSEGQVRDEVFQAVKEKDTELYILLRDTSKLSRDALEVGDEYELYQVVTDTPQRPSSREGYQKRIVPLAIRNAWTGEIAGAGG